MRASNGVLLLAAAAVTGCSGISVSWDYDPAANFAILKSYAWLPPPPASDGTTGLTSLADARIRTAVDRALTTRGFEKVEPDVADFLVVYHAVVERRVTVDTFHRRYGYSGRRWGDGFGATPTTVVREIPEGTLVLDFVDQKERQLMWRSIARATVEAYATPEERQKKINKAVGMMLEKFPPK